MISTSGGWVPLVQAGKLKLLATYGQKRSELFPEVPTVRELGYDVVQDTPMVILAPKGMDPKVVRILHDAFKKGMEDPTYRKILENFDMEPFYKNTEDYVKYVKELCEEEKIVVEKLGLKKK